MPRNKKQRRIVFNPEVVYFKPQGIPLRELEEVVLMPDELEALRLHEVENKDQNSVAEKMKVSQPTVARIISGAYKKIAEALIKGKAIRIQER